MHSLWGFSKVLAWASNCLKPVSAFNRSSNFYVSFLGRLKLSCCAAQANVLQKTFPKFPKNWKIPSQVSIQLATTVQVVKHELCNELEGVMIKNRLWRREQPCITLEFSSYRLEAVLLSFICSLAWQKFLSLIISVWKLYHLIDFCEVIINLLVHG